MSEPTPLVRRSRTFGSVAELYERYRPGYPTAVVDAVLRHARRPVRTALEVGAGTGKATRVFAAQGIAVTALEPDAEMSRLLAATTAGLPVRTVLGTLEQDAGDEPFDVVYAAAAWHWVDPAIRWTRAVDLLAPGGVLALFGCPCEPVDQQLRAAVEQVEAQVLPHGDTGGHPWSLDDLVATPGLLDAVRVDLPAEATVTVGHFLGRLSTVSGYLLLAPDARDDALAQVRAVLPDRLTVTASVRVSLGRRR